MVKPFKKMGPETKHRLLALAVLVLLSSCATLSKTDCQTGDWRTIGYRDGQGGHSKGRVLEHEKACGKHGIAVDASLYERGRREGLDVFCRPVNGYRLGLSADDYQGQCSKHDERDFLEDYRRGLARNRTLARSDLRRLRDELSRKTRLLSQARDEEAVKKLNRDIDNLQTEIRRTRDKLDKVRDLEIRWQ